MHESLRKLEDIYLKHDDKQISFFHSIDNEKKLFVGLSYVNYHFAD
jgi:hypothetical protein